MSTNISNNSFPFVPPNPLRFVPSPSPSHPPTFPPALPFPFLCSHSPSPSPPLPFPSSRTKLRIAQSHAKAELELVYKSGLTPYHHSTSEIRQKFRKQSEDPSFRIRIGYASANIKVSNHATIEPPILYPNITSLSLHSRFTILLFHTQPPNPSLA